MKALKLPILFSIGLILFTACDEGNDEMAEKEQANRELAEKIAQEVYTDYDVAKVDEYFSDDYVAHAYDSENVTGSHKDYLKQQLQMMSTMMDDEQTGTKMILADGDDVMMYWTSKGTANPNPAMGITESRPVDIKGISILRIKDGKVVESWDEMNDLDFYQQLGLIPSMEEIMAMKAATAESNTMDEDGAEVTEEVMEDTGETK